MSEEKKRMSIKSLKLELNALKEKVKKVDILEKQMDEMKGVMELLLKEIKEDSKKNSKLQPDSSFNFNCSVCSKGLVTKSALKKHIKEEHQRKIHCEICGEIFDQNCMLEAHMEEHAKLKEHECDQCGKLFHLKWRLKKHMEIHEDKQLRKCHYFNNGLKCPFEEIGCMFLHKDSEICSFGRRCLLKLCQYKHIIEPVINDTAAKEVKENSDKYISEKNDNICNTRVKVKDKKERIDNDKTVQTDTKVELDDNTKKADCVVCKDKLLGKRVFKCDECESDVCSTCHKKTFITKEWFMCLVCQ